MTPRASASSATPAPPVPSGLRRPPGSPWLALYLKEARSYFNSPTAYVVAVVFLLITGYFFGVSLFVANVASLSAFLDMAPLLLVFFVPAVTMRLFAEEMKAGTIEILATLPLRDGEILLAKYLAAATVVAFTLAATLPYPLTLAALGNLDLGAAAGAYLGLFLTGSMLAAIGLFSSTLTQNQIVAFILGFLVSFILFVIGQLGPVIPTALTPLTDFLGLQSHLENIARGVLDARDLLYYASVTGYFLFLAHLRLTARLR